VGWYCRYCPSVHTRELLVEHGGFLYDADAYNDDLPFYTRVGGKSHLVVPYSLDVNDSRFVRGTGFATGSDFQAYMIDTYDYLRWEAERSGTARMMSVGLHPRLSGRPGRTQALRRFLEHVEASGTGWVARRDEIARFWLETFPAGDS
jgi:peptidoglycan/xylan/chitin deacetylase (PgdA/CDA1 family)